MHGQLLSLSCRPVAFGPYQASTTGTVAGNEMGVHRRRLPAFRPCRRALTPTPVQSVPRLRHVLGAGYSANRLASGSTSEPESRMNGLLFSLTAGPESAPLKTELFGKKILMPLMYISKKFC